MIRPVLAVALFVSLCGCADSRTDSTDGQVAKALYNATLKGDVEGAKWAIKQGAQVDAQMSSLSVKGSWTLLMRVIERRGDTEMAKLLIEAGADVNARSREGATPLTLAAEFGHAAIVELLLAHGANVNAKNNHSSTALMYAAEFGHPDIVKLLLTHGADLTPKDRDGDTALTCAAKAGQTEIVQLLEKAAAKE